MGYNITFINTPLNIKKLRKSSSSSSSSIKFIEIPFNSSDHGLPPNSENSDSLPYNLILLLLQASLSLELPFKNLLCHLIQHQGGEKPVCVISDFFFGWVADVAHEFSIYNAIFSMTSGFGMACYYSMWMNLPHKHTDHVEFQLPDFPEAGIFHVTQLTTTVLMAGEDDPLTSFLWRNLPTWSSADTILFNTVQELDSTGLMYFRRKLKIPIWGIGPLLLPEQDRVRTGREATIRTEQCVQWLDKKEANSVIYVCFGSQNTISASQMMNLAKALDSSGRNFIWVVRPPLGFDINAEFVADQWLPEGFMQSIQDQDRGQVVEKWAPQMEILAHRSLAVFISHCGWNSVLESLKNGVPLLSWPMAAEQFYNAKFLVEEVGVCLEVARGTSFEVRQQDIMEKIELVMGENEMGRKIRRKSSQVKELVIDAVRDEDGYKGSSVKAIEELFFAALLKKEQITEETK
ncbi:hypothetical protein ACJIZ3_016957 [Penstemon smallii]|uniref:Glycosyltransferase n=1 Tax=Penstemon smallii TaxID=265156 RepID=A0ABD3SU73_9LAMI